MTIEDWEEEYKEQFMDYMKDGALYLSVRNFFRGVLKRQKQHFLEQLPKEFPMANDKSDEDYDGGWNDCLRQIKEKLDASN